MQRTILILIALFTISSAQAQFKLGFRGGLSTTEVDASQLLITNKEKAKDFGLAVEEANYSFHGGIFFRIGSTIFVQPEVLFTTEKVTYRLNDFSNIGIVEDLAEERYNTLNIPLMMGLKLGPLRLQAGPVGQIFLDSKSDLEDIDGYESNFSDFKLAYQAGIGLDIWKLIFDFKYEGSFTRFGNHITFFGEQYKFDDVPGRFVASFGFFF
jgi:hypothetical protein